MKITVTVNAADYTRSVEPRLLLIHFLRDDLGLTGSHWGCDTSNCGACVVWLNETPVKSCTVLAVMADGQRVTTVEGLATSSRLDPVQEAFAASHGLQCGFCTPGMMMTARWLLDNNPDPTESEVREAISGQICRCTGYENIVRSVLQAAKHESGAAGAVPGLRPGEGAMGEGLPRDLGGPRGDHSPGGDTAGAVPGLRPGEGAMGEGLPRDLGGPRGDHSPGGDTAGAVPGLRPGEGAMREGLPRDLGGPRGDHSPGGDTAGAVPGLRPGEGAMGEGLPHDLGGPRGDHSPGGDTAGAVPGLRPGEGAMGEGLPRDLGGPRGDHSPGGDTA